MKRIILLSMLLTVFAGLCFAQQSQIARVSSNGTTTLYTDLKKAMNEAQDDDFIYLPGRIFNVDSLIFKKRVNVVGTGIYPDSTKVSGKSVVKCTVYRLEGGADGSLQGVEVNGNISIAGTGNFTISKCMFNQLNDKDASTSGTISIRECVVNEYIQNYNSNSGNLIYNASNCIIYDMVNCHYSVFSNCIFSNLGINDYWGGGALVSCSDIEFRNCVFGTINGAGTTNRNNRSYNSHVESVSNNRISGFCTDSNTTYDDISKTTFVGGPCPSVFSYNFDYHINSASKASTSGTDNTQRGIYGSNSPYNPNPYNPHIYYKNIATSTDAKGQLQVTIKVQAH